ncbi:unnamed protein product [Vitrella brassicaformis CCMP3155]|uniref:Uncharacterized protein n=1 Tax=Vitrella brassicaformis (strain CCMP3155) TaxID=1169540 RepID=A0A0G4FQ66_VITBC|nr:unnamed protein product [Vitrella brassicaformis CCMP3155]|eukprot:CEM16574.1 unnamed protein product [Vitrella brassicaformis CCMP3155]
MTARRRWLLDQLVPEYFTQTHSNTKAVQRRVVTDFPRHFTVILNNMWARDPGCVLRKLLDTCSTRGGDGLVQCENLNLNQWLTHQLRHDVNAAIAGCVAFLKSKMPRTEVRDHVKRAAHVDPAALLDRHRRQGHHTQDKEYSSLVAAAIQASRSSLRSLPTTRPRPRPPQRTTGRPTRRRRRPTAPTLLPTTTDREPACRSRHGQEKSNRPMKTAAAEQDAGERGGQGEGVELAAAAPTGESTFLLPNPHGLRPADVPLGPLEEMEKESDHERLIKDLITSDSGTSQREMVFRLAVVHTPVGKDPSGQITLMPIGYIQEVSGQYSHFISSLFSIFPGHLRELVIAPRDAHALRTAVIGQGAVPEVSIAGPSGDRELMREIIGPPPPISDQFVQIFNTVTIANVEQKISQARFASAVITDDLYSTHCWTSTSSASAPPRRPTCTPCDKLTTGGDGYQAHPKLMDRVIFHTQSHLVHAQLRRRRRRRDLRLPPVALERTWVPSWAS